jgi:glucosamine-6-phosphate deaminase
MINETLEVPTELRVKEKLPVHVYKTPEDASKAVARAISNCIRSKPNKCVLGLATGSTPTGVYEELIRLHKEEGLSFAHVITFNLDEYYPMEKTQIQSYHRFMHESLFDHVDIPKENIHIPDGEVQQEQVENHCREYDEKIAQHGGIDLQLLGLGKTGHMGFNEPGSPKNSKTRVVDLDRVTRIDAASDFFGIDHVPHQAITMGISSIMSAKEVVMMAFSESKARILAKMVESEMSVSVPASYLQAHPNAGVVIDEAAASELCRIKCPWTCTGSTPAPIKWNPLHARKAVIWLSQTLKKPILKLEAEDYDDNHLSTLLSAYGPAPNINLRVFRHLQSTITGWPGGRPTVTVQTSDAHTNLEKSTDTVTDPWITAPTLLPPPKRVIVFSPHPDDDVISMGGTLIRLCDQGHTVHVAYQTSGNIAVWDDDAKRFANFATQFAKLFGLDDAAVKKISQVEKSVEDFIANKCPAEVDSPAVQQIKGIIRQTEARAAARFSGVRPDRIHFLELPFYETGAVKKNPLGPDDIRIVTEFLERIKPQQIYAAGDLSDPHGTHRVCLKAILTALTELHQRGVAWVSECVVWLYRGAWQEWEPERIEMAVPMSPHELTRKRLAIFKHQSQKDPPAFPGADKREFWVRAEARNRATAAMYDSLGLQEFEGLEAFVKWAVDDPTGSNPVDLRL